jgi:isopenicillin N synthase-like dioxygenase
MPAARTVPVASLPNFDFSDFIHGEGEHRIETAKHIVDAFKTYGFVYLVNHGISDAKVEQLFDWSRKFFALPESVRTHPDLLRPEDSDTSYTARCYSPVGREKLSNTVDDENGLKALRAVPDAKDMFESGPDSGPGALREPNRFPPSALLPGFEDFNREFFWEAHELSMQVLRSIGVGLGLAEDYFVQYHEEADNLFRLIRYPSVLRKQLVEGTTARTTPHTDYGSITILFQDDVGGLEVEDPARPGTFSEYCLL